jgi:hypothetical protein
MSGVVSVGVAATAIGVAAATGFETFAVIAAVGATIGAVGGVAHIKELQYAGAAIGAVGLIGGLANAAGMFGETGLFGPGGAFGPEPSFGASGAGELGLSGGAPAASGVDAATWAGTTPPTAGAPTTGYEAGAVSGFGSGAESMGTMQMDAVDMVNGVPQVSTGQATSPLASGPNVTPTSATDAYVVSGTSAAETTSPSFGAPGETGGTPLVEAPTASQVTGQVPDPARSLLNGSQSPMDINGQFSPIPKDANMSPAQLDVNGRIIPQGDAAGGTLGTTGNQAAPGEGMNAPPASAPVTGTNAPSNVAGDNSLAGFGSGSTGTMDIAPASQITGSSAPRSLINGGALDAGIPGSNDAAVQAAMKAGPVDVNPQSSWSSIMNFLGRNPILMYGAIQTSGSFLSGVVSPVAPAQIAELESRQRANDAATALALQQQKILQQRFTNMNAPMPVAGRSLINGGSAITGRV